MKLRTVFTLLIMGSVMLLSNSIQAGANCKAADGTTRPVPDLPESSFTDLDVEMKTLPYTSEEIPSIPNPMGLNVIATTSSGAKVEYGCLDDEKIWRCLSDVSFEITGHWVITEFPLTVSNENAMIRREQWAIDISVEHEALHSFLSSTFVDTQFGFFQTEYDNIYSSEENADEALIEFIDRYEIDKQVEDMRQDHQLGDFAGLYTHAVGVVPDTMPPGPYIQTGVLIEEIDHTR